MSVPSNRTPRIGAIALVVLMSILSCTGKRPANLGVSATGLTPCPSSPNCVSSDAPDSEHRVEPFQLAVSPDEAWRRARQSVAERPRTRIVKETPDYLHAECRSLLFGFVDDLELHLRRDEKIIAIRSASRLGHSDLGVNRRRVEKLRDSLTELGVLR